MVKEQKMFITVFLTEETIFTNLLKDMLKTKFKKVRSLFISEYYVFAKVFLINDKKQYTTLSSYISYMSNINVFFQLSSSN